MLSMQRPPPSRGQALAVHADRDLMPLQGAGELVAGELATPRFREGRLWSALKISGRPYRTSAFSSASTQKSVPSVFDSRHAGTTRLTQFNDDHQVEEALGQWNVGDIRAPDWLGRSWCAWQVRVDLCAAAGLLVLARW